MAGAIVQLWHPNLASLDKVVEEVQEHVDSTQTQLVRQRGPIMFSDVVADAMIFPTKVSTELDAQMKVRENATSYFEDKWIHQPLKTLRGSAPIDAAGHGTLKKRLLGLVQFVQDCAAPTSVRLYDFNRLRRKLGLTAGGSAEDGAVDLSSMSAAELANVDSSAFTEAQLAEAFVAALKLDAKELAGAFAKKAIAQPTTGKGGRDRFPFFSHLVRQAQQESKNDDALSLVDDGEKWDCESNDGKRRNDYELLRGQTLAKQGESKAAADVFKRLLERSPDELRYLETATKTMLDLKQGEPARKFANQGLEKARAQNNRDAEEYFMELTDAAKKLA